MDTEPTITLKDRIKALNLNAPSSTKPKEVKVKTTSTSVRPHGENLSKNVNQPFKRKAGEVTCNDVNEEPKSTAHVSITNEAGVNCQTSSTSDELLKLPSKDNISGDRSIYSDVPNNKPAVRKHTTDQKEHKSSIYVDIPSNRPVLNRTNEPSMQDSSVVIKEGHVFGVRNSDVSRRKDEKKLDISKEAEAGAEEPYATPGNIQLVKDVYRTTLPNDLKTRWSALRKTIVDCKSREMIDMSELFTNGENEPTGIRNSDVTTSLRPKRKPLSMNEVSTSYAAKEGFGWKRSSLQLVEETQAESDCSEPSSTPDYLTPQSGRSRESSYKSTVSNLSDGYDTPSVCSTDSDRRIRNSSDVSIAFEEVKGNTSYSGKLTLANDDGENRSTAYEGIATSPSREKSPDTDARKPKGKKLKGLTGKLTKVMKMKKIPNQSTTKVSPTDGGSSRTLGKLSPSSSPLHNSQVSPGTSVNIRSPHHTGRHIAAITPLPLTRSEEYGLKRLKSRKLDHELLTANEDGIYYSPSPSSDNEVIQEEDDCGDIEQKGNSELLTATKRSQSLVSLSQRHLGNGPVNASALSRSLQELRQETEEMETEGLNYDASNPPIPPPKIKSMRRKLEKEISKSDNSTSVTTGNAFTVKLRTTTHSNSDRQNWPNGRPPSMPCQLPPSPPDPLSEKANQESNEDENEYVSADVCKAGVKSDFIPSGSDDKEMKEDAHTDQGLLSNSADGTNYSPQSKRNGLPSMQMPPRLASGSSIHDDSFYHTVNESFSQKANESIPSHQSIVSERKTQQCETKDCYSANAKHWTKAWDAKSAPFPAADTKSPQKSEPRPVLHSKLSSFGPDLLNEPALQAKPMLSKKFGALVLPNKPQPPGADKAPPLPPKPASAPPFAKHPAEEERGLEKNGGLDKVLGPPPRPPKSETMAASEGKIQSPKLPPRAPLIAQFGKTAFARGTISQKTQKPILQCPNRPYPPNISNAGTSGEISKFKWNEEKLKTTLKSSSTNAETTDDTTKNSPTKQRESLTIKSGDIKDKVQKAESFKGKNRSPPIRPNHAPPPRPTGPPPPRPDQQKNQETIKPPRPAGPPSRPPPPSSDKVIASVERRMLHNIKKTSFEDEYHDALLVNGRPNEENPYADIDDNAVISTRQNAVQEKTPALPPRPKHSMKKMVHGTSVIGNIERLRKGAFMQKQLGMEQTARPSPIEHSIYEGINDG